MILRIALFLLLACFYFPASAATPSCDNTIEESAVLADCVVVGQVIGIGSPLESGRNSGPATASGFAWVPITIRVEQTLKGPSSAQLVFYVRLSEPIARQWLVYGAAIPIWELIVLVLLAPAISWNVYAVRRLIDNRRRGFPVLVPHGNLPVE